MALNRYNAFSFPTVFDEMFGSPAYPRHVTSSRQGTGQLWKHPGYEVGEDDKNYVVFVDVPGVRPEDMSIQVEDEVLRVKGGRKVKRDGEVTESKFDYRFPMTDNVDLDNITANLDSGVLQLKAPKKEQQRPLARTIHITHGPAHSQVNVEKNM